MQHAWAEPGVNETEVATELLAELQLMASWLDLDRIVGHRPRGDLGPLLQALAGGPLTASPTCRQDVQGDG